MLQRLKDGSQYGSAVIVQAAECTSREADLRMVRDAIAPSHVGLLESRGERPGEDLVSLVRDRLGVSESSIVHLPTSSTRALRRLGVTHTPVLLVWNDNHSAFMVSSVSADRRLLRQQLIAARLLLSVE